MSRGLMRTVAGLLAAGWLAASSGAVFAQKEHGGAESSGQAAPMEPPPERRPSPVEQQAMMQQAMGGMMGLMMESMARSMAKPEFAQNMAVFMRNYYKALIAQGFTEEEALKIVTSGGAIPQMGGRK